MSHGRNRQGQLLIVATGSIATLAILGARMLSGAAPPLRATVTFTLTAACALRYWWVIGLLPWPFRWTRLLLIVAAWVALPVIALSTNDAHRWVFALVALSAIGAATEVFNGVTGQWRVGSEAMTESLKRDHASGAVAGAASAAILIGAGMVLTPTTVDRLVLAMVIADCARLTFMIRRHRSFLMTDGHT
jgi:hypothetical protein